MIRSIFLFFSLFLSFNLIAQEEVISGEHICCEKLPKFIDSLKTTTINDTIKFKSQDVRFSTIGYKNSHGYSPLFIINNKYLYKLDIVTNKQVKEFVNEYLNSAKIELVTSIKEKDSYAMFGEQGKNGAILIKLKRKENFNPEIAGLTMRKKKKIGDNFSQRKAESILVRE